MNWLRHITNPLLPSWTFRVERVTGDRPHIVVRIDELPGFVVGIEPGESLTDELRAALEAYLEGCAAVGAVPAPAWFAVRQERGQEHEATGSIQALQFA